MKIKIKSRLKFGKLENLKFPIKLFYGSVEYFIDKEKIEKITE